ncbi:unnamed protein product [Effrenium voratum]|nr:unnamed protein product [Effrenium voratum]
MTLDARVAALRRLASEDVVPAVQELVLLSSSGEVVLQKEAPGLGGLVGLRRPFRLRLEAGLPASESAVVFGAIATSVPAELWRQRSVVELGCGSGYVGLVLSCLGARVTLTDLPEYEDKILSSIAANVAEIKCLGCLDWAAPRANPRAAYALRCASVVLAIDPVVCQHSQQSFLTLLKAIFGLEGPPLCPDLQGCIVAHKHQQNFCVGGYSAPSKDAAPSITHSDSCDRCTFRRALEDAGVTVRTFEIPPPREFVHPFIECWELGLRRKGVLIP